MTHTTCIILSGLFIVGLIGLTLAVLMNRRSHEKHVYDLLDELPNLIWLTDKKGRFIYTNEMFLIKILLCSKHKALDKNIKQITNEQLSRGINNNFGAVFSATDEEIKTLKTTKKFLEIGKIDDKFVALETTKTPLYEHGAFVGILGSARDVTRDVLEHSLLERYIEEGDMESFKTLFHDHKFKYITSPAKSCYPDIMKEASPENP